MIKEIKWLDNVEETVYSSLYLDYNEIIGFGPIEHFANKTYSYYRFKILVANCTDTIYVTVYYSVTTPTVSNHPTVQKIQKEINDASNELSILREKIGVEKVEINEKITNVSKLNDKINKVINEKLTKNKTNAKEYIDKFLADLINMVNDVKYKKVEKISNVKS